jgi:uncharacterized protein YgiM (DUF1202 family)
MRIMSTFLCALVLALLLSPVAVAKPKQMSLNVRKGELRSSASPFAKITATLKYADRVTIEEKKGAWIKVTSTSSSASGWIHSSALTKKKLKLKAGTTDADVAASSTEISGAGHGFSEEAEDAFKKKNKDVDFTWIDKMEKVKVAPKKVLEFLKKGSVAPPKGGAR